MKENNNQVLFDHMTSIGAKPKNEFLSIESSKLFSNFADFFFCPLFTYSLKNTQIEELNVVKDVFICKTSSTGYDFYEVSGQQIIAKNGKTAKASLSDFAQADIYSIERTAKNKNEHSLFKTLMSLTPESGYLVIPLVIFGILSPLYSNVFNSRLVYADSNLTFFLITGVFLIFVFFEFFIKKRVKKSALIETQKNITLVSDYFYDLFKSSKTSNLSIKIRNIEQTAAFIWENVPLLYVDIGFILLYSLCLLFILGFSFSILFGYYIIVAIYMLHIRFISYKNLIQSLKNSGEKSNFLFSFERRRTDLLFANNNGASSIFIENYTADQVNKSLLDSQNHKWNELTKMNSFVSMVVMYFCCFLSIKAGNLQISAVIAAMIVNSRLASSLSGMISKLYQLKVQKHSFFESCSAIFKQVRKILGININTVTSLEIKELNKDILKQKGLHPLSFVFEQGKTYALLGPSGSGKTTILKILSGEDIEYEGEVNLNKISSKHLSLQSLSKNISFHSANADFIKTSLKKNFEFYGISDLKQISSMLKLAAPRFELDHDRFEVLEAEQLHFSNGEKQKLLLMMAMAKKPSLIILDESTSFLSAADSIKTMEWIREHNPDAMIIFATHNTHLLSFADERLSLQYSSKKIKVEME